MNTTLPNQTSQVEPAPWTRNEVLYEIAAIAAGHPVPREIAFYDAVYPQFELRFDNLDDVAPWASAMGLTLGDDDGQPYPLRYDDDTTPGWISVIAACGRWHGWTVTFKANRSATAELLARWAESGQRAKYQPVSAVTS